MKKNELLDYHDAQMNLIRMRSDSLINQGFVKTYRDVYPDVYNRIKTCKSIAYIRGQVSLKMISLLYDKVIVYIPPYSEDVLIRRFQLTNWNEIIDLCQSSIVIPIIGKAENYTASHFDSFFKEMPYTPYSLWARGLALLEVFNIEDSLEAAKSILPVNDIASNDQIINDWKNRYPRRSEAFIKKRIRDDVSVMYADLCIFGCNNDVEELLELPIPQLYHGLQTLNEVQTYPVLFGLESQANFSCDNLSKMNIPMTLSPTFVPQEIPDNDLKILFQGIGININQVSIDDIKQYRSDGMGKLLRSALFSFNSYIDIATHRGDSLSLSEIFTRAEVFERLLREGIDEISDGTRFASLDRAEKHMVTFLKIGTIVAGGLLAIDPSTSQPMSVASLVASFGAIIEAIPEKIAHHLVDSWARGVHSSFVANTWQARRLVINDSEI